MLEKIKIWKHLDYDKIDLYFFFNDYIAKTTIKQWLLNNHAQKILKNNLTIVNCHLDIF